VSDQVADTNALYFITVLVEARRINVIGNDDIASGIVGAFNDAKGIIVHRIKIKQREITK
jgi:hypothetical protein